MFEEFSTVHVAHASWRASPGRASESVLSRDDFADAVSEISSWSGYEATPLHQLSNLAHSLQLGAIYYKDEGPRFGLGSFKALGGAYAGLKVLQRQLAKRLGKNVTADEIRSGAYAGDIAEMTLVSATDGNHGRSLSWGARMFGASCRIYIHREVSEGRADAMRDLGAAVIRIDGDYDESVARARSDADENGWFVVSDTSWDGYTQAPKDVMSGYGVMVREIVAELDRAPTHVFLQGGVGGLAGAVAAGLRQHWGADAPRVVVVEPELAACLFESARAGVPTSVIIERETLMAGLSCGKPSELAWRILSEEVSDFMTIPESLVEPSMRLAGRPMGSDPAITAGESAVAGLAAVIASAVQEPLRINLGLTPESRILLIGSEGATDLEIYNRIMTEAGANQMLTELAS